jgi:hypothetical protein
MQSISKQNDWWWTADLGLIDKNLKPLSTLKSNRILVKGKSLEIHWTNYKRNGKELKFVESHRLIHKNKQGNVTLKMLSDTLRNIIPRSREEGLEPIEDFYDKNDKVVVAYLGFDH